jgi:tetratricopeptide (TPR) repeat protein/predicted Ser/Thr protein kinase
MENMPDNIVRCRSCGNVVSTDLLTEEFKGACPWCLGGLVGGSGRRPTDIEELSPRAGPLPCDEPVVEMPPEARDAGPAAHFGRFIRVAQLGAGGQGEVWKAWDPSLGRWVALKFLRMEDPRDLAWFQREAHMAATLSHPHIAAIHDIGEDQGLHYIAMQFVEGRNLEGAGRVEPRRAAALLRDAARAVAHAHAQGIIHRDLKPANFMVTEAGHLYVTDFGLARRIDAPSAFSLPGVAVGTPAYMSPAQARGESVDARADVYSLGATLYELLAGRPPVEGVSIHELLKKVEAASIEPLRKSAPAVPAELSSIVMKCLARDPESRYATAHELADDLDRWLGGQAVAAHSSGVAYRARKFAARQVIAVAAIAAAAAVAGIVGAGYLRESRRDAAYVEAMARGQAAWEEVVRYTSGTAAPELAGRKAADARTHFDAALEKRDRAPAHLMRGRCLQIEGKLDEALAAWGRAQRLDPAQEDAKFEQAKAILLKYQTSRGKPPATVGRSANDPGGGTKVEVRKDTRPETAVQKELREKAERLLEGYAGKEHQSALLKGMLAIAKYEFEKGAELLAQYTKSEPWDAQAMRLEATAWYHCNRPKDALPAINRALERTQDAPSYALLGQVRIGADDDAGARDAYTKAIELDPKNPDYYLKRCYPNWRMNDKKAVEADATRAIELDPKLQGGWNSRMQARQLLGNLDGALADAEKVIELDPKKPAGYLGRGNLRRKKKDFEGAIADLDKAVELEPDNINSLQWRSSAHEEKAKALEDAGRPDQAAEAWKAAIKDCRRVVELKPKSAIDLTFLSETLRRSGDAAGADAALAEAMKVNPTVVSNHFTNLGHRALVGRRWKESVDHLRRAMGADPLRCEQRPHYLFLARGWMGEGAEAAAELAATLDEKKIPMDDWEAQIARFLLGRVAEEDFFKSAASPDEKKKGERRCEAFGYAGERRFIAGDAEGAKALYRRCLEQDQRLVRETWLSEARLKELEKK